MLNSVLKVFAGRPYKKYLKRCEPLVRKINEIEEQYQSLSDDELRAKTTELKDRHGKGESLDDLLPEAFAAVKNAARRLCGKTFDVCGTDVKWEMVHFDVQLIGGMALHDNRIAEMATGEGKTLVATLPLYLNAISGRNCQLVTVNDYLARRDAQWMGYLYQFLGLTVGCIQNQMPPAERREQYGKDITYGTASEFGFDYLRDNGMASRAADQVQRDHYFCIVDEIDSILIDEARTPLIISGPAPVERELPFTEHKAQVQALVKKQQNYCNELSSQAKRTIEKLQSEQSTDAEAWYDPLGKLLQVKRGNPKNKTYLRLMENGGVRKRFDKFELEMQADYNKTNLYNLKEELYFVIDEKGSVADLTEKGRNELAPGDTEAFLLPDLPTAYNEIDKDKSLSDEERVQKKADAQAHFEKKSESIHVISQLLRALSLYERDVEYIVENGKVVIIDENTGRKMPGRRWGDGLHQAVEAKEGVTIERETKTYATVTIQNYFRMYDKLAGMTGTAETEAAEFLDIYNLQVLPIPTNKPIARDDENDIIYKTRREKYNAAVADIKEAHNRGQPILVGTASVEASEVLSRMLKREHIPHAVLNAKYHEREAEIVARAGSRGAVTIATNMAGRGTDIKLGEGVKDLGGLYVLGTERHTARRIDRQLRGRSGRQGDPGRSRFLVSLEDDLMRLFANAGPLSGVLQKSFQEGEPLEHPLLTRTLENAQKKVEQQHYSVRKRLLQYDDVLNQQREVVYDLRNQALHSEEPRSLIFELIDEELEARVAEHGLDEKSTAEPDAHENLVAWINKHFPVGLPVSAIEGQYGEKLRQTLRAQIDEAYQTKADAEDPEQITGLERIVILRAIDKHWQSHLTEMEDLRQSVGLRGMGGKDPLQEYKNEAFGFFEEMMDNLRTDVCGGIFRSATNVQAFQKMLGRLQQSQSQARATGPADPSQAPSLGQQAALAQRQAAMAGGGARPAPPEAYRKSADEIELPRMAAPQPVERAVPKVGRNDPCPCGSGKKYKACHGKA